MKNKKKQLFSVILAIAAVFIMVIPSAAKTIETEEFCYTYLADVAQQSSDPDVDEAGYYLLSSAEDLLWFANTVNAGQSDIKGKLTQDIDLTDVTWTPIDNFNGEFDGQNHSICNINYTTTAVKQGLFGTNNGVIKNIKDVTGSFEAAHSNFGSIAGYNTGQIVNCHSSADITITGSGGAYGGITGYHTTNNALVEKCSFSGNIYLEEDITTSFAYIGGVVGRIQTGSAYVIGCINQGNITCGNSKTQYLGGIIGHIMAGQVLFSYNSGSISAPETGTAYVCGLGYVSGSNRMLNCYTSGTVSGKTLYKMTNGTIVNSYYLEETESEAVGAVSDAELRKNSIVSTLNAVPEGSQSLVQADCRFEKSAKYPVLVWENRGVEVLPVPVEKAGVTGDAITGQTLKAAAEGTEGNEPTNIHYQWQVSLDDGYEDIKDAIYPTFTLPDTAVYAGKKLRVKITGDNDSVAVSDATEIVRKSDNLMMTEDKAALSSAMATMLPKEIKEAQVLTLPAEGENGSIITWTSNNTDIITNEGVVTLPESGYKSVSLKAAVTMNSASGTVTFSIKVSSKDYQTAEIDKNALSLDISEIFEAQTLVLPSQGANGTTITWKSSNTAVITNDGIVTLPESSYKSVSLTATVTKNETSITRSFSGIKVYSIDCGRLTKDKNALELPAEVKESQIMELPAEGANGTAITWTSDNEEVISSTGLVTIPEEGYVTVTLKAALVLNAETSTKSFKVRVCSLASQSNKINVTFTLIGDDVHGSNPHKAFYKWIADEKREYTEANAKTALGLVDDVFADYGFERLGSDSYISGVVTSDGITLTERANGSGSGWMYRVNGISPNYGLSGYVLKDGDAVELYYVHSYNEGSSAPIDTPVNGIEMEKEELTTYTGQTQRIVAAVKPSYAANKNISWSSSDSEVVSVNDEGIITSKKAGTAVITATAEGDTSKYAECTVTVKNAEIQLNKDTLEIVAGQTDTSAAIKVSNPDGEKIQSAVSSDEEVVSVRVTEGMVQITGKKEGTAIITFVSTHGGTANMKVTVKGDNGAGTDKDDSEKPKGDTTETKQDPVIKLNYSSLKLQKGKSTTAVKIKSSIPKDEKIKSAVSSKKSIVTAKVSKGVLKITGKKKGTATVTVTSTSGAAARIKIYVVKKVDIKKLTMNKKKAVLKEGKKLTLTVTKNPVTATNKITWSSSNKKVASVNSKGVVKAKRKGTAVITARASNGKKATCKITVRK